MLTFEQAAKLGYTFDGDPEDATACLVYDGGGSLIARTHSDDAPRFFALRLAAELEGDDLASADVTPELVQSVSGETYAPTVLPPPVATSDDATAATAAIVDANLAAVGIAPDELATVFGELLAEARSAIPYFEKYALDASMNSSQWTAFQALPQAQKDRLLYDGIRSLVLLFRYLSGDLPKPGATAAIAPPEQKKAPRRKDS